MNLIKKIIAWIISLFRNLFFGSKKSKKYKKIKFNREDYRGIKRQKGITATFDEDMPSYMMLDGVDKEKLVYCITLMKQALEEKHNTIIENSEKELVEYIKKCTGKKEEIFADNEKLLNKNYLASLIKDLSPEDKKEVIDRYQVIKKKDEEFKVHLEEVDRIIGLINKSDISIVAESEINQEVNGVINDKNNDDIDERIDDFSDSIKLILENIDQSIVDKTIREYKKVNYITLSTVIIDRNYELYRKLEEDFKNHRYNRRYYEREINRIKQELNRIRKLKNNREVSKQIEALRKELYTKSKDKYDLLYNDEVFLNIEKECDVLLNKINAKVIDLKKVREEKEKAKEKEKQEENKNEEEEKRLDNILLRFQDMALGREIILSQLYDNVGNEQDIETLISLMYERFNKGISSDFNFDRNKCRTEFVMLINDLNRIIATEKKEPYESLDHINFKMNDLVGALSVKINEVSAIAKKRNIECDDELAREKIETLVLNDYHYEEVNNLVLTKSNQSKKKAA